MRRLQLLVLLAACAPPPETSIPVVARPDTMTLYVAGTTDVHGVLRGWDYFANAPDSARGLTRIATIMDSLRKTHPDRVVLVDAGDDLQGTPITSIAIRDSALPNPIIAAMNALRYDAGVIGNHEFNYGLPYLNRAIAQATFPMIAANVYTPEGHHVYVPWVMVTRSGVRVAIVGATTPGAMVWDGDKLRGRVQVRDILPAVHTAVAEVRARAADVVVVVLHSGLDGASSYDTVATGVPSENVSARVAREVPGIDLIVFGHSHRELADTTIGGVMLSQPRNGAASLSLARLQLVRDGTRFRVASRQGTLIRARGQPEQAAMLALTESAHNRAVEYVQQPLGTTAARWSADSARVRDTPIIDFILEVQRRATGADLASTSAFTLNADFGPGSVTMADIAELYPYENNQLRAIRLSGKQLREYLEFSARYYRDRAPADSMIDPRIPGYNFDIVAGVDYQIDLTRPIGSRIVGLSREGKPVSDTDQFTMALNDYRQSGGGGYAMLQGAPVVYDRQESIRELLIAEVRRVGTLRPADYHRLNWRIVPDSVRDAAYRSMRRLPFDRPRPTPPPAAP
ncbi:MAG TPA: 5'-nucleotidase C-terminal domain-containing protein [Gemmatimonadaceae bacterium]|nr:5'-nucleotidase C-terminal domain-containing protein [Gemmatimonadaceae bacterium]